MRQLGHSRRALALCLMLILGLGQVVPHHASLAVAAKLRVSQQAQRILYQTNWAHGTLGWKSVGDPWIVSGGALQYSGHDRSSFFAPITTPSQNFAVEARIKFLGPTFHGWAFGLLVRFQRGQPPGAHGWEAEVSNMNGRDYLSTSSIGIGAADWRGYTPLNTWLANSDFDPDKGWHTYRVEVRGNKYHVFVDGQLATAATSNQYLTSPYTSLGVFSITSQVSIKVFKVFALT